MSSIRLGPRTTLVSSGGYSGHHHLIRKQSPSSPGVSLCLPSILRGVGQLFSCPPVTPLSLIRLYQCSSHCCGGFIQILFIGSHTARGGSLVAQTIKNLCAVQETTFSPCVGKIPWRRAPVFLPGESQGRGSLVGCRLWGRTELDTTDAN